MIDSEDPKFSFGARQLEKGGRDGAGVGEGEDEREEGFASSSSTSSLTLVAWPPLVDIVKVADLP